MVIDGQDGTVRFQVAPEQVDGPEGVALLRDYFTEIVSRYFGRPATTAEVDAALADYPSTDLGPPGGVFLVLRCGGWAAGMVGLRCGPDRAGEIKRLYVRPPARGRGAARRLLEAAERTARDAGLRVLRLDTRSDLVEARALYASSGYREIPAYNSEPFAAHWFEKHLPPTGAG